MFRFLAGRHWRVLLPVPLLLVGVHVYWTQSQRTPLGLTCDRTANRCAMRGGPEVPLDHLRFFDVVPSANRQAWDLRAVADGGPVVLVEETNRTWVASLAADLNRFLGDRARPEWHAYWDSAAGWWGRHWLTTLVLVLVLYAALFVLRSMAPLYARPPVAGKRCGNGHLVPDDALVCPDCGARMMRGLRT